MRAQIERVCISVNTECNLACRYCYFFQQDTKKTTSDPLKIEEIVDILNRISQYSESENITKKLKVLFVGSGEPLLRWGKIRDAVRTVLKSKQSMIRFYLITNGTLLDNTIAKEMKELNIVPSISLDGYRELHDENRIDAKGKGTFDRVMKGIDILRKNNMEVIINTSVTYSLIENISDFFCFLKDEGIDKVIFNRLADAPQSFKTPGYHEFYKFLLDAHLTKIEMGLTDIEIGNIESLTRSILGNSDKVCTMFGSSCGAGTNFIIYLGKDVYPCGRMFDDKTWKLGDYKEPISIIQERMYDIYKTPEKCNNCSVNHICIRDCILSQEVTEYSCDPRKELLEEVRRMVKSD